MNTLRTSLLSGTSTNRNIMPLSRASQSFYRKQIPNKVIETVADDSYPSLKKKNIVDYFVMWSQKIRQEPIQPQNTYLLIWHSVIMFIILYYLFEMGILWGFGIAAWQDEMEYLFIVNIVFIICLLIDCVASGLKSYYKHGLLITNRRLIIKKYLIPWFWLDLAAIVSICIPVFTNILALNWLKVLFLVKIRTAYKIDKQFSRVTQLRINLHTFYLLNRLMILMVLGSHYLGIWFYLIDYWVYENNYYGPNTPNISWIYNAQAFSQMVLLLPWYGQYQYAMYYSIGVMTTIAYGDITPLNPLTVIYTVFALLLYTIGFGYILSQVLRILMEAQAAKFQHSNNLLVVSNLMKNNMIKKVTQQKVKSYFEKVWKEEIYRNRDIQKELIDTLPNKIKNQLLYRLYYDFYKDVGLLIEPSESFTSQLMIELADQTIEERLIEGHYLFYQGDQYTEQIPNAHSIYYLKKLIKGRPKPSVQLGVASITLETLTTGEFGAYSFFTGEPQNYWARAINSVLVYFIPRSVLLEKGPSATTLQTENLFLLTETIGQKKCMICGEEKSHKFLSCPYATYQPNLLELLKNEQKKTEATGRSLFERKEKNKQRMNALLQYKQIRKNPYQIKSKFSLLLSNRYYGSLLSKKPKEQKVQKIDRDQLNIKQVESENESESVLSSSESSESSEDSQEMDLQHYMRQTSIFIQYLEDNQKENEDRKVKIELEEDEGFQFTIYKPQNNPSSVLQSYAESIHTQNRRRHVQRIQFSK